MTGTHSPEGYGFSRDEGEARWLLGGLFTFKATAATTGGQLTQVEGLVPEGFAVPLHTHEREHEAFYVLEGEMAFTLGEDTVEASAGAFFSIPPGTPHRYESRSETRFLYAWTPAGFEDFLCIAGEPAKARTLPTVSFDAQSEFTKLIAAAPRHGMTLLSPLPIEHG